MWDVSKACPSEATGKPRLLGLRPGAPGPLFSQTDAAGAGKSSPALEVSVSFPASKGAGGGVAVPSPGRAGWSRAVQHREPSLVQVFAALILLENTDLAFWADSRELCSYGALNACAPRLNRNPLFLLLGYFLLSGS